MTTASPQSPRHEGTAPTSTRTLRLAVPAHMDYVASIRALTRSAGALSDLAVDDIEELQMAVDEAATLLLAIVPDDGPELSTTMTVSPGRLRIMLAAPSRPGTEVDTGGLAWIMLNGLDPEVEVVRTGNVLAIAVERPHERDPR